MREFLSSFFEVWTSLSLPSLTDLGTVLGVASILASTMLVMLIVVVVVGEIWSAVKRKLCPRPFIPNNTRRPPP